MRLRPETAELLHFAAIAVLAFVGGCRSGGSRGTARREGWRLPLVGPRSGALHLDVTDCPDGLAQCEAGSVLASRLATVPRSCVPRERGCDCPWDVVGSCARGCVADDVVVPVDASRAVRQLCAPEPGAPPWVEPGPRPDAGRGAGETQRASSWCDEGQLYRCSGGAVVDCSAHAVTGSCVRGCFAEGAYIDDRVAAVGREAAFAILCSR